MSWETVIGLEVHVQLATHSKIFSPSPNGNAETPNTHIHAIDLALPGTLPMLNKAAVEQAIRFGLAINARINPVSVFERKNYFYPDLPKGYQTSQTSQPIVGPATLEITDANNQTKPVRIHHAHLEEDAGKSVHDQLANATGIDLNRAGIPLLEIVTEPDMRNAQEAVAFAKKLHAIVNDLGISEADMSQGNMRFDVNISVRPHGSDTLGTRTETKNLNSFKFMEEAIELEVARQIDVLENGGDIHQETRLYNSQTKTAKAMRSKENANDYRYFPCPDLLPVHVDQTLIDQLRQSLPELTGDRITRLQHQYQLSPYDASLIGENAALCSYFEAVVSHMSDAKLAANWINGELAAALNTREISIQQSPINPERLAALLTRIQDSTISGKIAKTLFEHMLENDSDVDILIKQQNLQQINDDDSLLALINTIIEQNPQQVTNYQQADDNKRKKMLGFFVGQLMKATQGQANPSTANKLLLKRLNASSST